jgi:hypothetical protein
MLTGTVTGGETIADWVGTLSMSYGKRWMATWSCATRPNPSRV